MRDLGIESAKDNQTQCDGRGCPAVKNCWPGARRPSETREEWIHMLINEDFGDENSFYLVFTD